MQTFHTIEPSQRTLAKMQPILEEGKELIVNKKFKEAIEVFTKGLNYDPNYLEMLFYRGVSYLDYGKPNECIKDLQRLLSIKPDHKKLVYLILSIAYKRSDKITEALETLCQGLNNFPQFADIYLARAHIYLYLKQYKNALNDFRSFSKYAHKKTAGYLGEGDALKKLGRTDEAITSYSKIINDPSIKQESKSLYATALERRALTYFLRKDYTKSRKDFEAITNI